MSSSSFTADECGRTYVQVFADPEHVFYIEDVVNECTGESRFLQGEASPIVFKVRGNLASARVVADIPLTDATGVPTGEVLSLDNTWTSTGEPDRFHSSVGQHVPGAVLSFNRSRGISTSATAAGTVPFDSGFIVKLSQMILEVTHR